MRFLPATDCKATFHTCCESYTPRRVMFTFESSDPGHSPDANRPRRVMLSLPWSGKRLSLSPHTRCHYCWLLLLRCPALPSVCGHCTVSVMCLYPCVYQTPCSNSSESSKVLSNRFRLTKPRSLNHNNSYILSCCLAGLVHLFNPVVPVDVCGMFLKGRFIADCFRVVSQ